MAGAVFSDVDGTLTRVNLPRVFLEVGAREKAFYPWQSFLIWVLQFLSTFLTKKFNKIALNFGILLAVKGHTEAEVHTLIESAIPIILENQKKMVIEKIRQHQSDGLPLVMISAGMHEAITCLGDVLHGQGEGTHVAMRNGRYRMKLDGPLCQGEAKAERARQVLTKLGIDPAECYAYADSITDIPFLKLFGHPCVVDPDEALTKEAVDHHWPILRTT